MRGFNEFIKTAKTRVQKMVDAGNAKLRSKERTYTVN